MEFLNPAALYGLLALPLLLIPYLIKGRPHRLVFSSLLLLNDLSSRTHSRIWGRLRLPPIFFLQLLLLALLIFSLGEPVFSVRPSRVAIVLDNSASMQAAADGRTRFASAQAEARDLLRDLPANASVDLYLAVPRLEKVPGAPFPSSEAAKVIATLQPFDLGEPPGEYGTILSRLAEEQNYDRLFFLTDHPSRGHGGSVRVVSLGRPEGNLAIGSFEVSRSSLVTAELRATARIANYSAKEHKTNVALKGGGRTLASRTTVVPAGGSSTVSFEGFPSHPYYEVEIDARDALALDNRSFAVPPTTRNLAILAITPRSQALASIRSIPGVSLEILPPEAYEKSLRTNHSLEVFHFAAPRALPKKHALFILPPEANPLVRLEKPVSHPVISAWRESHPLTRYVNFALFRPAYARPLKLSVVGESIVESPEGALAIATEIGRFRYVVLGFDPFPYLGRENLPMSIFTLNVLDWFFEGAGTRSRSTGDLLPVSAASWNATVLTPKGEKLSVERGSDRFSGTFFQGIYRIAQGREQELYAVNFHDLKESDLRDPAPIDLRVERSQGSSPSVLFSLWPYLLLLALFLLLAEWFLNPPATGSRLRLSSGRARQS